MMNQLNNLASGFAVVSEFSDYQIAAAEYLQQVIIYQSRYLA
ncbi:hypothetical protein ACT691_16275 [Vibrio metschnikovii]